MPVVGLFKLSKRIQKADIKNLFMITILFAESVSDPDFFADPDLDLKNPDPDSSLCAQITYK